MRLARTGYMTILADYPYSHRRSEALYGLGQVYVAAGRPDSARAAFADALDEDNEASVAPHALSWWARTVFQQGDTEQAISL